MTVNKKYDFRVVQDTTGWVAEITRRATAKKTVVSKRQDGFDSETTAQAWAEKELKEFLKKLHDKEKTRKQKSI